MLLSGTWAACARIRLLLVFAAACVALLGSVQRPALHNEREFDLVIFGATGYVGSLLTASLLGVREPFLSVPQSERLNSGVAGVRFALAGRNPAKLRRLIERYSAAGVDVSGVGIIVANMSDAASLDRLAQRSRVVLTTVRQEPEKDVSTVGSFGEDTLIRRCIEHGTSLLDLDGFWLADEALARDVDAAARATGAAYSPACGEVAVLPDMITYRAWDHLGRPQLRRSTVQHLYYNGMDAPGEEAHSLWEAYDAPVMHWSAKALGYGASFAFAELSQTNGAHERYMLNRREAVRRVAQFVSVATVEATDGRTETAIMSGGEIDYEETARICLEMGLSLVHGDDVPAARAGGLWTPAAGWGKALLRRLAAIGLDARLAAPGETAATIVRDTRARYVAMMQEK